MHHYPVIVMKKYYYISRLVGDRHTTLSSISATSTVWCHIFAVVQARNLPGMSTNDLSSPFVSVELCPVTMFPGTTLHRTPTRTSTINPVYEEKFEL